MVTRETSIAAGLTELGIPAGPDAVARLSRFAELLEERAIPEGFLGPNEAGRIVVRHLLESCSIAPLLPDGALIDIGSGAGLPGVALACVHAQPVVLCDSNERRGHYLREIVADLGVAAEVMIGRAEEFARTQLRDSSAGAVCRALAAPAVALELCLPFVAVGGRFVWLATLRSAAEERSTASATGPRQPSDNVPAGESLVAEPQHAGLSRVARLLGGSDPQLVPLEVPGTDARRWAMIVNKLEPTPDRFPRRTGVPARRPLG